MPSNRSKMLKSESNTKRHDPSSSQQSVTIQSPMRSPIRSPAKNAVGITQTQKQALIDNLQLESKTHLGMIPTSHN